MRPLGPAEVAQHSVALKPLPPYRPVKLFRPRWRPATQNVGSAGARVEAPCAASRLR